MTNEEKIEAFRLRLQGLSWDEIGERLYFSGNYIYKSLKKTLTIYDVRKKRTVNDIVFPVLREIIISQYGGSIAKFLKGIHTNEERFREFIFGNIDISENIKKRAADLCGMSVDKLFMKE